MIPWNAITSIGDSTITLSIGLIIVTWLFVGRAWHLALSWCIAFGIAMLIVTASKIAFIGWGIGSEALDFTGFSGHAARATAVFPMLFYLAFQRAPRRIFSIPVVLGWLFSLVICVSRVVVGAHSISEAVTGAIMGTLVSLFFLLVATRYSVLISRRWLMVPSILLILLSPVAEPAPTQQVLTAVALKLSGHEKPFERAMWKYPRKSL